MTTVYTIPTSSEYWGADVTPEEALEEARRLRDRLQDDYPQVEFRLVEERQSYNNRASGDEALIEEIKWSEELFLGLR